MLEKLQNEKGKTELFDVGTYLRMYCVRTVSELTGNQ